MYIILYLAMLGISFFDWKYLLIPDYFHVILIINRIFMCGWKNFLNCIPNGLFLTVPLYLLRLFMNHVIHGDSLGEGDIKLLFSLGIYFHLFQSMIGLLMACIVGLITALFYLKDNRKTFPFGPCICLGFLLMMIGEKLV